MILRICFLFLFLATNLSSEEIEIPDDLTPIEGASKIEYSYEFDEQPYFIERLNDDKFLVMTLDDTDIELFEYSLSKDTTELKMEFEFDDDYDDGNDEVVENYLIKGNKLYIFTYFYTHAREFGLGSTGFLERAIIIDLTKYEIEDCKIVFTNYDKDFLEKYIYKNEWDYCKDTLTDDLIPIDYEKLELIKPWFRYMISSYDKDTTEKTYFGLLRHNETNEIYLYTGTLNLIDFSTTAKLNLFNDGKSLVSINYINIDENSNIHLLAIEYEEESEVRNLVACKITPEGKLTRKIHNIPITQDEDSYKYGTFEAYKNENGKVSMFGFTKHDESRTGFDNPISSLIWVELNLNTLEIEYKEKLFSIEEGEMINGNGEEFRFNTINKIVETKKGYTILTEVNHVTYGFSIAYSQDINLFSVDNNLNILWNNHIDRDFYEAEYRYGNTKSNFFDQRTAFQSYLKPELKGNNLSFIYSTTEPEDEIISVSYDINTGKRLYYKVLFQNDNQLSYFPWYHFEVEKNEYIGLLTQEDYFLVRYKLLK